MIPMLTVCWCCGCSSPQRRPTSIPARGACSCSCPSGASWPASGLPLVKAPHATAYAEDGRPVDLVDLAPTVLGHFGQPVTTYHGAPVARVKGDRERTFYAHSRDFDGKVSKYQLAGDGWRFTEDVPVRP